MPHFKVPSIVAQFPRYSGTHKSFCWEGKGEPVVNLTSTWSVGCTGVSSKAEEAVEILQQ